MRCEIDGIITAELPTVNGVTNSGKSFEKREYIIQDTDKISQVYEVLYD